jgi:DNA repair exonuclease SbcCD ATPase subunit
MVRRRVASARKGTCRTESGAFAIGKGSPEEEEKRRKEEEKRAEEERKRHEEEKRKLEEEKKRLEEEKKREEEKRKHEEKEQAAKAEAAAMRQIEENLRKEIERREMEEAEERKQKQLAVQASLMSVPDTEGIVLPYAEIKGKRHEYVGAEMLGIHVAFLEAYLDDEEFQKVFSMSKQQFYACDQEKRMKLLEAADLQ